MTDREWIERTLRHEPAGAVPYNFMFSPPALRRAEALYGSPIEDTIELPLRMMGPRWQKPLYADPAIYGPTITDDFGVVWSTSPFDRGSPIGPCLSCPSLDGYAFPDPLAESRLEHLSSWCARQQSHFRILWIGDLWERATFMRGMEPLLLDVALNPAFVDALLERLTEFVLALEGAVLSRFDFEAVAVSDDYGTQRSLLLSPRDWRRLIRPRLARVYSLAKRHGRRVLHHSCGHITPVIGDLIDIGLDILHPVQPEAMDLGLLKREFGRRLTFCGGVPTQALLATGTPEAVRAEVRRLKRELGEEGGYILEPGITLQDDVPQANLGALIDQARRREEQGGESL